MSRKLSKETEMVKAFLSGVDRMTKTIYIYESNLTEKEARILDLRFIQGLSVKETAARLSMEVDTVNKAQKRAINKFYDFNFTY